MAIERWSEDEVKILVEAFDSTRGETQELLEEKGYTRTIQAIKTKRRDLRASGDMPAYGTSTVEPITGAGLGEAEPEGEGFFSGVPKREIYSKYKNMMQELVAEAKTEAAVKKSMPGTSEEGLSGRGEESKPGRAVVSDSESLVVMISDTHIGKHVVDENGNSIYNIEIALQRLYQIGEGIKRVISHAKCGTNINEIVVTLIGDILDGSDIYKTQAHHQDAHLAIQLKAATQSLWGLIVELSNIEGIEKVRVATVRGNHGRASDSSHEDSNYDNLLYDNLQFCSVLHGDSKISVETQYAAFHVVPVKGHRILLRHEAPLTCDTSAARAKLGGWCEMHGPLSAILSGHYHHVQVSTYAGKYIMRNGSVVGPDNLSERMGVSSEIEQICFGVSQKRLPTFIYPITLS